MDKKTIDKITESFLNTTKELYQKRFNVWVWHFYDNVEDNRREMFEHVLDQLNGKNGFEDLRDWMEHEEIDGRMFELIVIMQPDIIKALEYCIEQQKEEDKEAAEDYYEKQDEYRKAQGWNQQATVEKNSIVSRSAITASA